jgi:hypothetical protein
MNVADYPMTREPSKVNEEVGIVADFLYDTEGTRYHVLTVKSLASPMVWVMAEPADLRRAWFSLDGGGHRDISEAYVAEKTGADGVDAHCLTKLIAHALGVRPIYRAGTVEPWENT